MGGNGGGEEPGIALVEFKEDEAVDRGDIVWHCHPHNPTASARKRRRRMGKQIALVDNLYIRCLIMSEKVGVVGEWEKGIFKLNHKHPGTHGSN